MSFVIICISCPPNLTLAGEKQQTTKNEILNLLHSQGTKSELNMQGFAQQQLIPKETVASHCVNKGSLK